MTSYVHNIDTRGLAGAQAGIGPLIVSAWGALSPLILTPGKPLKPAVRQVVCACDLLLVDTPALVEPARALLKPGARVEHLPMGTNTRVFVPGRTEKALQWRAFFAIPGDAFMLLSPRLWAAFYRHQDILRAFARAFPRLARPAILALVGLGDGPQALPHMAAAWQEVAPTAAAANVRWLPRIRYDEMPTLYAMSDAVVNYPSWDSFGATLVEAAACQKPLITALLPTYRGAFVERYATLVAPDDIEALADAMVQVVNQPPAERSARLAEARNIIPPLTHSFNSRIDCF